MKTPKHIVIASKLPLYKLFALIVIASIGLVLKWLLEAILFVLTPIAYLISCLTPKLPDGGKLFDTVKIFFTRLLKR